MSSAGLLVVKTDANRGLSHEKPFVDYAHTLTGQVCYVELHTVFLFVAPPPGFSIHRDSYTTATAVSALGSFSQYCLTELTEHLSDTKTHPNSGTHIKYKLSCSQYRKLEKN